MDPIVQEIITRLKLEPLPGEGGFFRQTWRSETASAITFLMTPGDFSALHRIAQDELWFFHAGDPVEHVQFGGEVDTAQVTRLGADVLASETPQLLVPAGFWQGARPMPGEGRHGWSLLSCTVSPPWDERTFELATRAGLQARYPGQEGWIRALVR